MPQTASAKKALRASKRRRIVNDRWREKVRQAIRLVRDALKNNQPQSVQQALTAAQSAIDRAARRNILSLGTAARKKSRLYQLTLRQTKRDQ